MDRFLVLKRPRVDTQSQPPESERDSAHNRPREAEAEGVTVNDQEEDQEKPWEDGDEEEGAEMPGPAAAPAAAAAAEEEEDITLHDHLQLYMMQLYDHLQLYRMQLYDHLQLYMMQLYDHLQLYMMQLYLPSDFIATTTPADAEAQFSLPTTPGSSPLTAGHYMIVEDQTIVSGSVLNVVDALMLMFAAYYLSVIAQNWELPWSSCRGQEIGFQLYPLFILLYVVCSNTKESDQMSTVTET
ncbi:hypothetical protein NQZ68_008606 [Dissostichus eleginoides]|nr:hypothetical protein NQZ68_008606 [Dissostichus eleginoides]